MGALEAIERLPALAGPILYPCPRCRLEIDLSERSPGEMLSCLGCGSPFEVPGPETWTPRNPLDETLDDLLGTVVEGIRIDRVQAARAGTTIYRGYEIAYGRPVAVKRFDPSRLADPATLDRLRQEVRLALGLRHPDLVGILGLVARGNTQLLIMEFVEGTSLDALLEQAGPLPVPRALKIGAALARALAYLHERAIVHRDVKPGNVFLGLAGEIRLGDLELLERTDRLSASPKTAFLVGTPSFMAPELFRDPSAAGPASDVYSLGATLYQTLSGELPYYGHDLYDTAHQVLSRDPKPLASLRPDLPRGVVLLVECLMARRPQDRPRSPVAEIERLVEALHAPP
ncbi:MAG: serine/threonine protein kinase [Planctomycetes bacterium]|nr:serine/threonine protein kinase [Planctomycetota bacterium]